MRWHLPPRHRSASSPSSRPCSARTRSRPWRTSSRARSCSATTSAASADVSKLTSPHRRRQAFDPTFAAMHLTPAMVDDLMAIEPLAAHDLLNGVKQEPPRPTCRPPPRARRSTHRRGRDEACHGEVRIGAPGAMLNATCRLVVRQHGYGPVDPGSADRWRNAQVSRKGTPLSFLRARPPNLKNFGRKSGPPKFR